MATGSDPLVPQTINNVDASSNGFTTSPPAELLTKITSTVYRHSPAPNIRPSPSAPGAILLFGWMGAPIRYMTKFAEYYSKTLFPGTPIIVILSPAASFFSRERLRHDIQPAVTTFQALEIPASNVLVHIFSMGGVNALKTFMGLCPSTFSPRLLVLDSAPAKQTLSGGIRAFTADFRNPVIKFVMKILLFVGFSCLMLIDLLLRRQPMLDGLGRWLNEAVGKETRRLYLYSDGDELVLRKDVENSIAQAREKGYSVKAKSFGGSPHVGHMRANPELYWREIVESWKE
jgi:hypothetical protein